MPVSRISATVARDREAVAALVEQLRSWEVAPRSATSSSPDAVDQPEHLRVLIGSLRKKFKPDPSNPRYILTEPWVGYRFADAAPREA